LLTDLLASLNAEKREIMSNLLESVQTSRLTNAFEKYLPAVLANKAKDATPSRKTVVTESRKAVTGDKAARVNKDDTNIIDIKTLAGLK
jgi:pyridoxine 5'-phosphate synthase PdxJ